MTVKHNKFLVEYADDPTKFTVPREVEVRVLMVDRLNVEMRGRKYGLSDPTEQPQLTGFLWLYFAMLRQGDITDDTTFVQFQERCLDNMKLEDEPVPPTGAESADSASASRSPSLALIGSKSSDPATTD